MSSRARCDEIQRVLEKRTQEMLNIISREQWGAKPPTMRRPLGAIPVGLVAEDHWCPITINKKRFWEPCLTQEECTVRVREMQEMAFKKGRTDLEYSFLIGGDGNVYEGRGWTTLLTDDSLWEGILCGYIGKYTKEIPVPDNMKQTFKDLVAYGKERMYIRPRAYVFEMDKEEELPTSPTAD